MLKSLCMRFDLKRGVKNEKIISHVAELRGGAL